MRFHLNFLGNESNGRVGYLHNANGNQRLANDDTATYFVDRDQTATKRTEKEAHPVGFEPTTF